MVWLILNAFPFPHPGMEAKALCLLGYCLASTESFNSMKLRDPELDLGLGRICLGLFCKELVGLGA